MEMSKKADWCVPLGCVSPVNAFPHVMRFPSECVSLQDAFPLGCVPFRDEKLILLILKSECSQIGMLFKLDPERVKVVRTLLNRGWNNFDGCVHSFQIEGCVYNAMAKYFEFRVHATTPEP